MLKANGKNTVRKGEVIFTKGEELSQIGIVLAGKVLMQADCIKMVRPQGTYLALNGIGSETYSATYTAIEDSVIYALPLQGEATLTNIIGKNADFRAIMISSQFRTAVELYRVKTNLSERAERLYTFAQRTYEEYKQICKAFGIPAIGLEDLEELTPYEGIQDASE